MAGKVSSDPNVFLLPDIGEGLQEAELIRWLVAEGDTVEENQSIAEVNTDKALTEIPSPRAGVIAKLHGAEGDIMPVGEPFVSYVPDGEAASASEPAQSPPADADPESQDDQDQREDAGTVVGKVGGELAGMGGGGKAKATPAVRRIARDLGIDIDSVRGTGIGGRVTERDVRNFHESGGRSSATETQRGAHSEPTPRGSMHEQVGRLVETAQSQRAPVPAPAQPAQRAEIPVGADSTRIPIRGVRRNIAQALRYSVDHAVHFNVMDEADVTELDKIRKRLAAASGEKVSFLPFVCSAVARALTGPFGAINATIDEEKNEIIQHRSVHLGIAADTDQGLMVPVVRDADRLGVLELGRHVNAVASAAKNRSISREQLSGSTFTISNVGSYAGRFATPIINHPEVGIIAVGRTRDGMVVRDGWFRVGKLMPLSLACDHRVIDGATAALCLAHIVELLQTPESLLEPAR